MKKLYLILVCLFVANLLIAQNHTSKVERRVDRMLEKELKKEGIHNAYISVYAPSKAAEFHLAKGAFKDGRAVTVEHPFYTASIGKTFTATAIGMLVEKGVLHFDDPIRKFLPDEIMKGLHVLNDIDYSDSIKILQLLQHTSGLPDYFDRVTVDGSPAIFDLIMSDPTRLWNPVDLIAFSKDHFRPYFPPGDGFMYTDTEYVLLGMIIEKVTQMQLHEFFTKEIFQPLGMSQTYLNQRSTAIQKTKSMSEMYAGEYEVSTYASLTADWAGGAIVSTGKDLITFQAALFGGRLVSENTLEEMQQWIPETRGMYYGYGLRKIVFKELSTALPDLLVIGHSGLNGTSMYYCPELDIYLAGTLNQLEASKEAVKFMVKVLMACKRL